MITSPIQPEVSAVSQAARRYYDAKLRAELERDSMGKAVAIHVDSGEYAVADSHAAAAELLMQRHPPDGRIVTMTIGPPTDSNLRLDSRLNAGTTP